MITKLVEDFSLFTIEELEKIFKVFSALHNPKTCKFICKQDFYEQILEVLLCSRPSAACCCVMKNELVMVFVFTQFSLLISKTMTNK